MSPVSSDLHMSVLQTKRTTFLETLTIHHALVPLHIRIFFLESFSSQEDQGCPTFMVTKLITDSG